MSENGADPETAGPWAVPSTWVWTEMGAIADVAGGGTPSTKDTANYDGGEIAWITPADLSGYTQKYIQRGSRNITSKGLRGSSARLLPSGTVLFSSRAPIGYVAIASRPVSTNQGFKNFVLNSGVQPDYAYYYLKRAKDLITQLGAGTTFKEVSGAKAARVPCPLPPLPEQHRIVAEIEKHFTRLDASVAALQRARANLKRYRAAVLQAACEGRLNAVHEPQKKGDLPPGWRLAAVRDIGRVQLGRQRSPKNRSSKYPTKYIRAANITWNGLDLGDVLDMDFGPRELENYRLLPGDVVIAEASGSADQVGKPAIWKGELQDCCFQNTVIRLRPNGTVTSGFALVMFSHYARNGTFSAASSGVGIHHLSAARFGSLPFPLPPLAQQKTIVAEVERRLSVVGSLEAATNNARQRAGRLRQAILKLAFEGRLVAQDPNDEPASVLLDRIRAERAARGDRRAIRRSSRRAEAAAAQMRLEEARPE